MDNIDSRIEKWQKRLLDLGKKNRLINYRETKRYNIRITSPGISDLYQRLVMGEETLSFPYSYYDDFQEQSTESENGIIHGDLETNRTISEQQKTLSNMRSKAKIAAEEQGVNILYLSFGFLNWREISGSSYILVSPIILVPVTLTVESITSPYVLRLHEDEIVINPTLTYKLENDFGIVLPDFEEYENHITKYLSLINTKVSPENWNVTLDVGLSLLSFLKINMYRDIEKNKEKIKQHPIIRAISGDTSEVQNIPDEFIGYNLDEKIKPIDVYQVLDADSSQQDAILAANSGTSFVLQGPPGTGKSQTITNIIGESLASGKKILFVSEKKAALDVVYKRLTEVGLNDFCLNLHSHKAKKKEVLSELGKTLGMERFVIKNEALGQLEILRNIRGQLNLYASELHDPCLPLRKSIYEANGNLAKFINAPDIIFHLDTVGETTNEQLIQYSSVLQEFSQTVGKMSEDYLQNPWRNCQSQYSTHELRHDIETNLRNLLPKLVKFIEYVYQSLDRITFNPSIVSMQFVGDLISILDIASNSPIIPDSWITDEDDSVLLEMAKKHRALSIEYLDLREGLLINFTDGYFALDAQGISDSYLSLLELANKYINPIQFPTDSDIADSLVEILSRINRFKDELLSVQSTVSQAYELLGIHNLENDLEVTWLSFVFECLLSDIRPSQYWFDFENFEIVKKIFQDAKYGFETIHNETSQIFKIFDQEILNIEFSPIQKRYRSEYSSIFKIFNKEYWADRKVIKSHVLNPKEMLTDGEIIILLDKLKFITELTKWKNDNNNLMASLLGGHYDNHYTDWDTLEQAIISFEKVIEYFGTDSIPQVSRELFLTLDLHREQRELIHTRLENYCKENITDLLEKILTFPINIKELEHSEIVKQINVANLIFSDMLSQYEKMGMYCKKTIRYEQKYESLLKLVRLQNIRDHIEKQSDELISKYQFKYTGITTNWDNVINSLIWATEFKEACQIFDIPYSFIKQICSDKDFAKLSREVQVEINKKLCDFKQEWEWFLGLFSSRQEFYDLELLSLYSRTEKCLNNLSALEEWIDYRGSREKCRSIGLSDYIEQFELIHLSQEAVLPAFLKRFYRLWLDAMLPNHPAVALFRRRTQDQRIQDFSKLDNSQIILARERVKQNLVSRLPDINNRFTSSHDEVGILKRELGKQRRIMPLRKLFKEIPNLLLTLKPCLMMSPLSVSLFLASDVYKFDIILFDEASQICTEDAVGAIMRGNQVVIAGDSRQLPPTNFFNVSTSGEEFDVDGLDDDDEYNDTDAYESILDEAVTVLPERTLQWHYRSRHEDLITFSNAKIYNNSLITFPSHIDRKPNYGVEYIEVPNGVYDRSGRRCNVIEAQKVADLVFDHIRSYPERSLGVVTFSEAQQQAVDAGIRKFRLNNPSYEYFFNEDKEESFFIKNLENVQGDERDTIIFSIGYAKDYRGTMHMNFGPLSRSGGYRRLNVAITRAKYNVKLVGSIRPTDIDIEKTESDGVKMLRSYIDYAIHGPDSFKKELTISKTVNTESPFEESVYEFLVDKGYRLTSQVGCSGYRIDMAIKHPSLSGEYVLGIECDGATYHSTRTARERDRLRQSILQDMGWKIHRIWSTDWVKDPINEGARLINEVEYAISSYSEQTLPQRSSEFYNPSLDTNIVSITAPIDELTSTVITDPTNPYNFPKYKEADISLVPKSGYKTIFGYQARVIAYVIEQEYPIHIDLLVKRVACVLGAQRATVRMHNMVQQIIDNNLLNEVYSKGDFYWIKDNDEVRVRIPLVDTSTRKIEHISIEEIAEAMYVISSKSFGIMQNDLLIASARVLGFNRNGPFISQSMQEAYDYLITKGRILCSEGKINAI